LRAIAVAFCDEAIPASIGQNSRYFPLNREFSRICPDHRRLPAKTMRQISTLPIDSRSGVNREFKTAQSGIKFAEPGIIGKDVRAAA
jgi:hypothetical protein